mgnify:FL=1
MREIDAVLFDFGGVFTASPFDAIEELEQEIGSQPGQILELVFGPYHEDTDHPWHRLERGEVSLEIARNEIIELGNLVGIDSDPFTLFARMGSSGIREEMVNRGLALRKQGYRTALVTNNAHEFRERWVQMIPVDELFDSIIDSSEVGVRKPDPRIYQLALESVGGVDPRRALFLDDLQSNVDAAERLGIRGLLVTPNLEEPLAALDQLINS